MPPHPWQRQPDESPADFTAFACYLRLKGRRSARAVATRLGRSPAVEARLAEVTQDALDHMLRQRSATKSAELERLRADEFRLAQEVLQAAERWLSIAANPRRRPIPLNQIIRLLDLASRLGRLAAGMPLDIGTPRLRREDQPGYWTGPSVEEALQKIYGPRDTPTSGDTNRDGSLGRRDFESAARRDQLPANTCQHGS